MRRSRPFSRPQSWAKIRRTNRVNQIYLLDWRWTCNSFLFANQWLIFATKNLGATCYANASLQVSESQIYLSWYLTLIGMVPRLSFPSRCISLQTTGRYIRRQISGMQPSAIGRRYHIWLFFRNHQFSNFRSHLLRFKRAIKACSIRRNSLKVFSFVLLSNKTLKSEFWQSWSSRLLFINLDFPNFSCRILMLSSKNSL